MAAAFQFDAFQNDAFQVAAEPVIETKYGGTIGYNAYISAMRAHRHRRREDEIVITLGKEQDKAAPAQKKVEYRTDAPINRYLSLTFDQINASIAAQRQTIKHQIRTRPSIDEEDDLIIMLVA